MSHSQDPDLDLTLTRIIKAPRSVVWRAWTDPRRFERWWVPAPAKCRVVDMDLHPGGSFATEISEDGAAFGPHVRGCFLDIAEGARLVFTTALIGGWRPAEQPFLVMTTTITMQDHPAGTDYAAHVMHRNRADARRHEDLGFHDGWGAVTEQLAAVAESGA
jgi:uncharacterized protein YndB with AHSA1/START domain